ncbi:polysaccharide deacetylase family protein [Paenibacillus albicereus]|uniref:Polysaccharide deacetylase family protein n=1 Tax=Paenibacillus albicereus TaxID=2726185 RepID=A0A6H2GU50_9BACL|nr:polysaccharide deacetylase family protein [Paenibacillus albicereus]QJC50889.1 polysaccharide deacetylase family protein [Paenibacillus albicereus]
MTATRIVRGNPEAAHCAFTFDDGPIRVSIDPWLDALEQGGARGTFFLTGEWLDRYPEKAREMLARGHEIATHTYHHRRMGEVSRAVFFEEMMLAELAYQEATGRPVPTFMRFPYASFREENLGWLREWDYYLVEGEDTVDWAGPPSAQLVEDAAPRLVRGSILIFHANENAKETPQAVRALVRQAHAKGLASVPVSELLQANGVPIRERSWQVRFKAVPPSAFLGEQWKPVEEGEELRKLAADSLAWGNPKAPTGAGAYVEWLKALSDGARADGAARFAARSFAGQHWAYARASIQGDTLVLEDFATKEPHADALVYVLQWAAHEAAAAGCAWISSGQDMRRIRKLCEQLDIEAEIVPQEG